MCVYIYTTNQSCRTVWQAPLAIARHLSNKDQQRDAAIETAVADAVCDSTLVVRFTARVCVCV